MRPGRFPGRGRLIAGLAPDGPLVAVKAPVDSLWRLPGVDAVLGPEMRSTGEVLGLARIYADAVAAAEEALAPHRQVVPEPAMKTEKSRRGPGTEGSRAAAAL